MLEANCLKCPHPPEGMNLYGPTEGETETDDALKACLRLGKKCAIAKLVSTDFKNSHGVTQIDLILAIFPIQLEPEGN